MSIGKRKLLITHCLSAAIAASSLWFVIACASLNSAVAQNSSASPAGPVATAEAQQQFLLAARRGDLNTLRWHLANGVDVDTRDENGRTALLIATYSNEIAVAKLLIDASADVNAKDAIDDSPYLYAGAEGRLEILLLTLDAGADLSSVNRYGGTALIPAAHHGHVDVVRELLKTEIDIDHVNYLGWTALLETVILGDGSPTYQEIVRLLVDAGADRMIADRNGITPLEHALRRGYAEIAAILEGRASFH